MAHMITANNGAGSTSPEAIDGYDPSRESRNVFHDLLDGTLGVSYIAPRPRSGTLTLVYRSRPAAFAAYALHAAKTAFTLVADVSEVSMVYALDGSLDISLHPRTGKWVVSVGFQELL